MSIATAVDHALPRQIENGNAGSGELMEDLQASIRSAVLSLSENIVLTVETLREAVVDLETSEEGTTLWYGLAQLQSVLSLMDSIVSVTKQCPEEVEQIINELCDGFASLSDCLDAQVRLVEVSSIMTDTLIPALERLGEMEDDFVSESVSMTAV